MLEAVCRRIRKLKFQRLFLTSITHCIAALKGDFFPLANNETAVGIFLPRLRNTETRGKQIKQ